MKSRILIIEDDETYSKELREAFEDQGFDAEIWGSLNEVLDGLNRDKIEADLAIVDIMLPTFEIMGRKLPSEFELEKIEYGRKAGVAVCQRIKGENPALPIIVLTVVRDKVILDTLTKLSISKILYKPVEFPDLLEVVQEVISGKSRG